MKLLLNRSSEMKNRWIYQDLESSHSFESADSPEVCTKDELNDLALSVNQEIDSLLVGLSATYETGAHDTKERLFTQLEEKFEDLSEVDRELAEDFVEMSDLYQENPVAAADLNDVLYGKSSMTNFQRTWVNLKSIFSHFSESKKAQNTNDQVAQECEDQFGPGFESSLQFASKSE